MFYYSPSSLSLGHSSYAPRRSYRPASYYLHDEPSPALTFEDLRFSSLSRTFESRVDPETRYRRALHELEVAEHDLEAHIALERARQVTANRQRAAAEAARRERAQAALQAEIERIEHARASALQAQVEERLARRQQARWARDAAFDRGYFPGRALLHPLADADAEDVSIPRCFPVDRRPTRPRPTSSLPRRDDEVLTLGDILKLFTGVDPEPPRASAPQRPTSLTPAPSQPSGPAEPKPESPERDDGEVTLNDILEFFHGIAAQAQGVAEPSTSSQGEPTPVDSKGKGKAKAEKASEPVLLQTLLRGRLNGGLDQEMRDLEEAIKLSLQDRDAAAVKQAQPSKASRSSPSASSSKVTIRDASSSGPSSSAGHNASSRAPSPQPISPLTSIRAVRSQFSTLESAFKFPPVLEFDHSELAVSTNNAPVRAYEQALSGLLEQLDAIESDGDEEVREVRRNVVREVERALEDVERKVKEKAPQVSVPEVTKEEVAKGYDVESEAAGEAEHLASQDVPSDDVALVAVSGSVKRTSAPVAVSLADADVDQAISGEYQYRSALPVAVSSSDVAVVGLDGGAADVEGASTRDAEAVRAPVDELSGSSDSVATIIPRAPTAPAVRPSKITAGVPSAPESETFLESISHAQFTFPPKPASSQSSRTGFGEAQDDAVLVGDDSSGDEVGSVKGAGGEDGWSEVDA